VSGGGRIGIGLDIGTSGCRAVALDQDRQPLAGADLPLPGPVRDAHGAVEQVPALWWSAAAEVLCRVARGLPRASGASGQRCALCVDATSATLLLCTPLGEPLGPALMYNDTSARAAAARIASVAPEQSPARGASSGLAKLLRLAERHAPAGPVLAMHQADWVLGKLAGRFGDSDWNNALKLGFDAQAERWPAWVTGLLPAPVSLPRVHAPGTVIGRLAPDIARATGLPRDTLLCAGTTDSTAAVIATGAARPGDAVTSLGSTLVLKLVSERPITAARFGVYSHRLPVLGGGSGGDLWLAGGASNSGGAVLRRFFTDAALAALSPQIDPGTPSGLDYYPLPGPGERFPYADPDLAPRLTPRPDDDAAFLKGLLEGIARIERDGYARLVELGAPAPVRVLTTGGGARNAVWTEMRRRLLGVPVASAARQDAAHGAALLALAGR
jgi:hypothetical protein